MITLYQAAGQPKMQGDTAGTCRVCGRSDIGLPFGEWVRPTFTDHDKLQPGDIVCHACLFSFDEQSELLMQRVGKDKPQRMRNYSHFVVDGEWIPLSKGDKARMREILMQSPELAVIAVSGQKHIVFRAQPGWWQIEESSVQPFPDTLEQLRVPVEALYTMFSKSEIETGDYAGYRILKFGLPEWQGLEVQIARWRGSIQFELALFLAQREKEIESDGTTQESSRDAGHPVARHLGDLQEPLPDDDMDSIRRSYPQRGLHQQPKQVAQLPLFEA